MQCKDCIHQAVCMHEQEFERLEGQLPVTGYPFKSTVTCEFYRREQPQARIGQFNQVDCKAKLEATHART
jgi:hypothetical protein